MLSSLTRHFNETVFRGPDTEGGGGNVEDVSDIGGTAGGDHGSDTGADAGGEGGEGEPQEKLTVREQIKKSIAETSEQPPAKPKRDKGTGRFGDRPVKGQEAAPPQEPEKPAAPAAPAPADLPADAKAEWDKTPPAVQAAFIKRGQEMERGVNELKQKYSLIDQAIAPHTDALRQMNATPQEAVNRMFLWFKALAGSPAQAFPELAKSMGIDWAKLSAPQVAGAPDPQVAAQGTGSGAAPEISEPVRQYVGKLENHVAELTKYVQQIGGRFGSVEENINSQNMARTNENLSIWSKDKDYFNEVRQDMAKLIQTGVVPLKPNGQVDLDTAYERAIYFNPEVRAKVIAAQQQANQAAQQKTNEAATTASQTQVNRARKATGGSLPASTTPGAGGNGIAKPKPGQKMSVRDSLKLAVSQLRDQ